MGVLRRVPKAAVMTPQARAPPERDRVGAQCRLRCRCEPGTTVFAPLNAMANLTVQQAREMRVGGGCLAQSRVAHTGHGCP